MAQFSVDLGRARDPSVICGFSIPIAPHGEAIVLGDVVSGNRGSNHSGLKLRTKTLQRSAPLGRLSLREHRALKHPVGQICKNYRIVALGYHRD
jgi:hypothetical protein